MINSYRFGKIVVNGRNYSSDVIVFPDRIQGSWWRHKGHELSLKDITRGYPLRPSRC